MCVHAAVRGGGGAGEEWAGRGGERRGTTIIPSGLINFNIGSLTSKRFVSNVKGYMSRIDSFGVEKPHKSYDGKANNASIQDLFTD